MPITPSSSHTLDITDPRVRALLAEPLHLSVWEVLRRFGRPASTLELAQAIERSESTVQASIDALSGLQLLQSKATAARPRVVRHEVVTEALLVAFDGSDPEQMADLTRVAARWKASGRAGMVVPSQHPSGPVFAFDYVKPVRLDECQLEQLKSLLKQLRNLFAQAASAATVDLGKSGVFCTHQVVIEVHPCKPGTLPQPQIVVAQREELPIARELVAGGGLPSLSTRERAIALALAAGTSRPAIARELGLSVNTVATVGKRVYAKLKVRNRAELANKLRGEAPRAPGAAAPGSA